MKNLRGSSNPVSLVGHLRWPLRPEILLCEPGLCTVFAGLSAVPRFGAGCGTRGAVFAWATTFRTGRVPRLP